LTTTHIPFGLQLKEINLEIILDPRGLGFRQVEWRGGSASIARGLEKSPFVLFLEQGFILFKCTIGLQ
jgi:hypothetical protein